MSTYVQLVDSNGNDVAINPALVQGLTVAQGVTPAAVRVQTATEAFVVPGTVASVAAALVVGLGIDVLAPLFGNGTATNPLGIVASSPTDGGYMSAAQATKLAGIPADAQSAVQVDAKIAAALATLASSAICFEGGVTGLAAGTVNLTYANGTSLTTSIGRFDYPLSACRVTDFYFSTIGGTTGTNPLLTQVDFTIYKNGVATALTGSIAAGVLTTVHVAGAVDFAAGDKISMQCDNTNGGTGNVRVLGVAILSPIKP